MRFSPVLLLLLSSFLDFANGQEPPQIGAPQVLTNREVLLKLSAPAGPLRLESSQDLVDWGGLSTILNTSSSQYTDSGAPFLFQRFYRARAAEASNAITGDHLATGNGEVTFHPIEHATFLISWNGATIYCDPVGGAAKFTGLPRADLILVTHVHSDHFESGSITAVKGTNCTILAPLAVYQSLPSALKSITTVLTNGATTNLLNLSVEAIPAYNPASPYYHPKGTGNGYILTIGGKRIYVSGDTEDVPEVRALRDIDVAFVCMNLPYTMSVDKAADAVREMQPKVVYVYHYRGYGNPDVARFKQRVGTDRGIEVRLRKWY
jgi:L-ascorbate metabolism protein UlaG (beta-lactamase superfamily)